MPFLPCYVIFFYNLWPSPVSWSAWTRWSPCSRTCGTGQKVINNLIHCLSPSTIWSVVNCHEVCFKNLIKGAGQGLRLTREGSGLRSELKSVVDKSRNLFGLCFKVCTGEARDEAACQEASCPVFWWHLSIDFVLSLSIQVFWEDHLSWLCEFIKFTLHHILHWWWCLYFDNGNYLESTLQHVNHWYYLHCL